MRLVTDPHAHFDGIDFVSCDRPFRVVLQHDQALQNPTLIVGNTDSIVDVAIEDQLVSPSEAVFNLTFFGPKATKIYVTAFMNGDTVQSYPFVVVRTIHYDGVKLVLTSNESTILERGVALAIQQILEAKTMITVLANMLKKFLDLCPNNRAYLNTDM